MSGPRPPIAAAHLRKDAWWALPLTVVIVLGSFIVYSTWAAFQNAYYWAPPYLSPFYSPCLSAKCLHVTFGYGLPDISLPIIGILSPAFLILWGPGLFRLTCYYYRKAYYRSFWLAPAACAVRDVEVGLHRRDALPADLPEHAPLRLVRGGDLHRAPDLGRAAGLPLPDARRNPRFGIGVGTLVMWVNVILLAGYTFSCHSCRHVCGGHVDVFSRAPDALPGLALPHPAEREAPDLRLALAVQRGTHGSLHPAGRDGDDPRPEDHFLMAKPAYETHEHDVIVIGAGGAGLRAAIEAAAQGVSVGLVCKSLLGKAHTVMAEGGIAAALGNVWPEDNWQVHFRDTMRGGKMLNNWRMAQLHAQEAPERVLELERWGALFDRTKDGLISQRDFGGHRYARLAHVGDRTGLEMIRTLQYHGIHQGIDVYMECNDPAPAQGRRPRRRAPSATGARTARWSSSRPRPSCSPPAASARPGRSRRTPGSTRATATRWPCGPAPT